jgi:hypothetical protein
MVRTRSHSYHVKQILDVSNRCDRHIACPEQHVASGMQAKKLRLQILDPANQVSVALSGFGDRRKMTDKLEILSIGNADFGTVQ